jgi:hypothetical protein
MEKESGFPQASRWRIDLARELAPFYSVHDSVKMVVLGGSPSKGLADRYSDLDVVVYWDRLDRDWIGAGPLNGLLCERRAFSESPGTDICLESWFFGTLKADFGHVTLEAWEEMAGEVTEKLSTDGGLQKSIQGFLDSIVLYGHDLAEEWKRRLSVYPEGLARKMVESNLRLYVRGCLLNQGWNRGERLFFYDGLCTMFKRILGILAGVNRVYFTFDEPRWVEQELHWMPLAPADLWTRMKRALEAGGEEADRILEELIGETVELVREHVPEADTTRLERREALRVDGCDRMPVVRPASR